MTATARKPAYCSCGSYWFEQSARNLPDDLLSFRQTGDSGFKKDNDWRAMSLSALTFHIVNHHHYSARLEMPRLNGLLVEVALAHGRTHPQLRRIKALFRELRSMLSEHMLEEEATLFPYIQVVEDMAGSKGHHPQSVMLRAPIRAMSLGHTSINKLLKEIREASSNYAVPPAACFSCKILFEMLNAFDRSLIEHLRMEDDILFPRAIEMQKAALQKLVL